MEDGTVSLRIRSIVVLVVCAALVGAAVRGLVVGSTSAPRVEPPVVRAREANRDRDADGAIAAAVSIVRSGQRLVALSNEEREAALRTLAAPGADTGWVTDQLRALTELDGITARGAGPLTWDVSVLATRVDAMEGDRARVRLWRVGIVSIEGLTAPIAEFATVTYELVWSDASWRVWSETQQPGPSPMPHPEAVPSSPREWSDALAGFARFPGREPVTNG